MQNTCINITGKLPLGLIGIYADISEHAKELAIDFLVVGAMARDMVLVHGYGSTIERGTRDVDFGINVGSWNEFNVLRDRLLKAGYKSDIHRIHRLTCVDSEGHPWEIDIVPFGEIAGDNNSINWPPGQGFVMNVLGFSEAFEHALSVQISEDPDIVIPVASPAGICLLKLVSWLDREVELRAKDATDFEYLIKSYSKIPEINDALFEDGYMEAQEWDEAKSSVMKLGEDVGKIASVVTMAFLEEKLFNLPNRKEQFARDMQSQAGSDLAEYTEKLNIFAKAVSAGYVNRRLKVTS
ncbi:MAG: nucleotidyl transferase AbiEii/AbiGii toxin family protein [Gammaproteobacteria bacterium]|nr:MAG: nucleotidyl transferase AbiEii/AbiGii toxin family protein [Gammaproteobacteria bacterium]